MKTLSKEELISRLEAINRSNAIIDFDLDGNIIRANDIFLQAMGYKAGESAKIAGKHHSIFVTPEYAKSDAYKEFWQLIKNGEFFTGEFERIKKDGSPIYLQATYNPILDENGNTFKIMKIAIDITENIKHQNEIEVLTANLKTELENSEALKKKIEIEKNNALNDLDALIKKSQSELISTVVKVALIVIMGVGLITTGLYTVAIFTSKDTQIIGSTWSNMFGILLTNAFSIVGTIMGVKYATENK
jgi:methyl-accepting chemotaxis protein